MNPGYFIRIFLFLYSSKKKKHGKKKKAGEEKAKLEKRLSTMDEEDEDLGLIVKVTESSLHI